MEQTTLMWILFNIFVLVMLALDLGVFHRQAHEVKIKEALAWSAVWISLAFVFNALIYYHWDWMSPGGLYSNKDAALAFLTGYLIEKSLSVDNVFAILGLRALYFALAGIMGLFHYLHYGLSAILVFVGGKMVMVDFCKIAIEHSLMVVMGILVISVIASKLFPPKEKFETV